MSSTVDSTHQINESPDSVRAFLEHLKVERRSSQHTLEAYSRDLSGFWTYTQSANEKQVTAQDIRSYLLLLRRRELSPKSIGRALYCLRSYFKYLANRGLVSSNPASQVRAPKGEKRIPKVLDVDQVKVLLDKPAENRLQKRDKAMFEVLYSTGIRLSELVGLDVNSVSNSEGLIQIVGKGNKMRVVPLGSIAIRAIHDWLETRGPSNPNDPLFTSRGNNRISPRAVQVRLKKWGEQTLLSDRVHPHLMRHSFASHMLESSSDLRSVQEMLGHSNISTTQIYTHLDFQHLAKVYDESHPRSNKAQKTDE